MSRSSTRLEGLTEHHCGLAAISNWLCQRDFQSFRHSRHNHKICQRSFKVFTFLFSVRSFFPDTGARAATGSDRNVRDSHSWKPFTLCEKMLSSIVFLLWQFLSDRYLSFLQIFDSNTLTFDQVNVRVCEITSLSSELIADRRLVLGNN